MSTINLTPAQHSLIEVAAGCADRAIRWPVNLRGGARTKVIAALIEAGVAENRKGTLVVTDAGMRAVGIEPKAARKPAPAREPETAKRARRAKAAGAPRKMREGSKQAQLIEMLKRPEGATIAEIADAFGWQPHTVRGAIAGALKKKLGLDVTSEKIDGRGRVYKIVG
jgi:hypothetical protein